MQEYARIIQKRNNNGFKMIILQPKLYEDNDLAAELLVKASLTR